MSHPVPTFDPQDQHHTEDSKFSPYTKMHEQKEEAPLKKLRRLVGESQQIRSGNLSGKKKDVAKKMGRLEKHKSFVKKNPHKHSPYVKYEEFND